MQARDALGPLRASCRGFPRFSGRGRRRRRPTAAGPPRRRKCRLAILSETVRADASEGDIGMQLYEIATPILGSRSTARVQHGCGAARPRELLSIAGAQHHIRVGPALWIATPGLV